MIAQPKRIIAQVPKGDHGRMGADPLLDCVIAERRALQNIAIVKE
jgi:hypothetical protein